MLLSIHAIPAQAQIPNPGFEIWVDQAGGYSDPLQWTTNNHACCVSVTPDLNSHSGFLALNVINNGPGIEGPLPGWAQTVFTLNDPAYGITFYVRCDSMQGTGKGMVQVYGFSDGNMQLAGTWETTELIPEYTEFHIMTTDLNAFDSVAIRVEAWAGSDPLGQATGHADLSVDDLHLIYTVQVQEEEKRRPYVVNDPDAGIIRLHDPHRMLASYRIVDYSGRLITGSSVNSSITDMELSAMASGAYLIMMREYTGDVTTARFIVP